MVLLPLSIAERGKERLWSYAGGLTGLIQSVFLQKI
jgi:hypothetical protein